MFNWLKRLKFGYKSPDYTEYLVPRKVRWLYKPDMLSLASKQSLLASVKSQINHLQRYSFLLSNTSGELYQVADKNNPETAKEFKKLNNIRDINRKVKKEIKKLARIAKELKMSMK